jgi:hypothetical protein
MVSKKAMAAKGKKALECREGSPLTNAKELSAKSQGIFFFPSIKTFSCCNLIRNMLFIEKTHVNAGLQQKRYSLRGGAKQSLFIAK